MSHQWFDISNGLIYFIFYCNNRDIDIFLPAYLRAKQIFLSQSLIKIRVVSVATTLVIKNAQIPALSVYSFIKINEGGYVVRDGCKIQNVRVMENAA